MYVEITYDGSQTQVVPDHIEIKDRWSKYGHVTVRFPTLAAYDEFVALLVENRPAVAELKAGPEPVDGCSCGQPDLPSFDHARGCARRTVAA